MVNLFEKKGPLVISKMTFYSSNKKSRCAKTNTKTLIVLMGKKTYLKELFIFVHSIFPDLCVKYFFSFKQKHL